MRRPRHAADETLDDEVGGHPDGEGSALPDLSALPIIGISRRRLGFVVAALVTAWIVVAFARQVGEATAATGRLEAVESGNAQLAGRVAALQHEYELIQRPEWIAQQARGYQMGIGREVPFSLADGAPPLVADAPGSAALRVGAKHVERTPLETWLSLLLGPSR
ncbi:MAG TPA: hypothetical protein VKA85_06205 [Candidatus Limnocylindrales bacterium]|nr:hypothetical protein [Candidatus Limnocylindrales bacterium]